MRDVIKCTVMLADITEWSDFNEVYKTFFSAPYPARSALGANGLALGARVEVECVAVRLNRGR
jgi:2-iminobutanoate/2-iminopropanoate deaminase